MNKKLISILCTFCLTVGITGCSSKNKDNTSTKSNITINTPEIDKTKSEEIKAVDTYIQLGDSITIDGQGASVENNIVSINSEGTYSVSGELKDGQIIVETSKEEKVQLQLNNVTLSCSNSAPIHIKSSKKVVIALIEGTKNTVTDGSQYVFEDSTTDEPNATIFSKEDLTIIGTGELVVNANYNNGITSKDDLRIEEGKISVNSVGDGLRGKDSITILDGDIIIDSKEDGIKSSNSEESDKGYIHIAGGTLNINSGQDAIQAETNAEIASGQINIVSGEGSQNSSISNDNWGNWGQMPQDMHNNSTNTQESDTTSAKGIKAGYNLTISGGNINIDSSDDSIHTNDSILIKDGTINIASGDDGIHADSTIEISGGDINITKSYEGIESQLININDGNIHLVASDDGINAGGGNDGSANNGRPGANNFNSSNSCEININGGYIVVDASGDGLDANGSISVTDGTTIVNGPENGGNGSLDYDSSCEISGGTLIATGSLGMVQSPSQTSSQNSVNIALSSQMANTIIRIEDENGNEVITFAPSKKYQSVIVSSPELKKGSIYKVFCGGTSTGDNKDGLYLDGKYSGGIEEISFTISDTITNIGSAGSGNMQQPSGDTNRPNKGNMQHPGGMQMEKTNRDDIPQKPQENIIDDNMQVQ